MRELTRPEGRWAVERQHVSGTVPCRAEEVNQAWNWVNGLESSWERVRAEDLNWAACCGWLD